MLYVLQGCGVGRSSFGALWGGGIVVVVGFDGIWSAVGPTEIDGQCAVELARGACG